MKNHLTWVHRSCSRYVQRSRNTKHSVMPPHDILMSTESWWDVPIFCPREKGNFATGWRAVFSNDKPPQPWPRGRPQVRFRAKLQQIGRTVWCRPFGTDSGSLPPTGRASLTSSLTVLIYSTQKEMCTQKAIPPPAVAQSYLLVMSTVTMSWIIRIFPFLWCENSKKYFKILQNIVTFFSILLWGTCCCGISQKIGQMENTNLEVFSFLSHLRVKLIQAQPLQTLLNCLTRQMITPHIGAALAECSWTCHYRSFIYHSFSVHCFLASPCFYPNSKRIKQITEKGKEAA